MFRRLVSMVWGSFDSTQELKKFLKLAGIFGLIIGIYWIIHPVKDSVFLSVVGKQYLWMVKIVSLFVMIPLVILYSKLLDIFHRHNLFYILLIFYAILSVVFTAVLMHPTWGLANTVTDPTRIVGWALYVWGESFGSLVVALFWAITTDITDPLSARRGFPIIALFGQLGNMVGPFFIRTDILGLAHSGPILAICGALMMITSLGMWSFRKTTPDALLQGYDDKKHKGNDEPKPGFFDGLKLLLNKTYLLGILCIIAFYEIIATIIDNHFKATVAEAFTSEATRSAFLSKYAYTTGFVASLCVLFGINAIQRKLGMKVSLLVLPPYLWFMSWMIRLNPASLYVGFWAMVSLKAVNYALQAPTLKQLYIPTTQTTKYKAQAWMETFGSRSSKAVASGIAGLRGTLGVVSFLTLTVALSTGLVAVWVMAAIFVAHKYDTAIRKDELVC